MDLRTTKWVTILFVLLTPLISLGGLAFYVPRYGIHPLEPILCAVFVAVIALVISSGYHRYFAHKTYHSSSPLKIFYLIVGAAAFQQSALIWAADHRMHHRYVDTEKDPYSIQKGFWWAHIGWLFAKSPPHRNHLAQIVPDLVKDRWVLWQHRYWIWISIPLAFGLPLLIGFFIDRPIGMFLWAGLLRIAITHQTTFTVNSIAHKFGTQPYTDDDSSRDVWWLAPLLCGENYHNYHHRFQSDYRNGVKWYQYDPTKWLLWLLSHTSLVKNLKRIPSHRILRARLEMDLKRIEKRLKPLPSFAPLYAYLLEMRKTVEETARAHAEAKQNYNDFKKSMTDRSCASLLAAQNLFRAKKKTFDKTLVQWRQMIRWSYRYSPALLS